MGRIIVIGENGSGKSSVINTLCVNGAVATLTGDTATFTDNRGNTYIEAGWSNEHPDKKQTANAYVVNLEKLLNKFEEGVNLIIFVIRKGRITETMVKLYKIFVAEIFQGKVPVILAIPGCEMDTDEFQWYKQNEAYFKGNEMSFNKVVCGCFTQDFVNIKPSLRAIMHESFETTKKNILQLVNSGLYDQQHTFGNCTDWFNNIQYNIRKLIEEDQNYDSQLYSQYFKGNSKDVTDFLNPGNYIHESNDDEQQELRTDQVAEYANGPSEEPQQPHADIGKSANETSSKTPDWDELAEMYHEKVRIIELI